MPQRLRIFVSSPADVPDERLRAALIVDKLSQDYSRFFTIEFLSMGARGDARVRAFPGCDRAAERLRHRRTDPVVAARHAAAGEDRGARIPRHRRPCAGNGNRVGIRGSAQGCAGEESA